MPHEDFVGIEKIVGCLGDRRAGLAAGIFRLGEDKVGLRRVGEPAALLREPTHASVACRLHLRDDAVVVGLVAQRSEGGRLGEAVDVVAVAHAVEHADDPGGGERVANPDARQGVGLGERADDDEIRVTCEQRNRIFPRKRRVGFVDDEQPSERREHALEVGVRETDAGRRIGRG